MKFCEETTSEKNTTAAILVPHTANERLLPSSKKAATSAAKPTKSANEAKDRATSPINGAQTEDKAAKPSNNEVRPSTEEPVIL